ncbi:cytochrome P450 [Aspergillus pseudodeflectus]|uniref:Cytochrome P450 n=1 Tax=Aspergillus pseudodeflectus TaxID=176178 RepID=A0ABR4K792_9EURO
MGEYGNLLSLSHAPLLAGFCLCLVLGAALFASRSTGTEKLPLPPQPKGNPILGNLSEVITASKESLQHLLMHRWAREHGEVFRVRLGPEIMDRSSAISSERPRWIVSNELICNQLNVLLLHGSDLRWKPITCRPLTCLYNTHANTHRTFRFLHYETARFLYDIVNSPEIGLDGAQILKSIARYTYSAFATQTFGMDVPNADDPVIDYIHETGLAQILGTIPGMHMVDIFTWLNHLPLSLKPWERDARRRFKRDLEWCLARLQKIKDPAFAGKYMPDAFLPSVISASDRGGFETEAEAAYLALQLIIGAADTSQISTWSFLEAMLQFPDVQRKARTEIEAVVGNRLPEFADLERIPYIRCVMKELWRWRPPVSLGHPHVTAKDIVYNGQRIPKGARLHLNAWAISHDPKRHEDPDRFWPERYANDHTTTTQSINSADVTKRDHFAFGAGRRICPGYHVAERSLAIAVMRILWAFEIKWAPGTREPVDPLSYMRCSEMPGNASSRLPVTLRVLSREKADIINCAFEAAKRERVQIVLIVLGNQFFGV